MTHYRHLRCNNSTAERAVFSSCDLIDCRAPVHVIVPLAEFLRPPRLDVGQDSDDLFIGQDVAIDGHIAFMVGQPGQLGKPVLGDVEQLLIGMVPGVAGLVVGRSRQAPVGLALPPVFLTLQIDAVAGRAMLGVDQLAPCDDFRVVRFEQPVLPIRGGALARSERSLLNSEWFSPADWIALPLLRCSSANLDLLLP